MGALTTLTAADRCDRCGAQALARTQHGPGPLLWCLHHYHSHEAVLSPFLRYYRTVVSPAPEEPVTA